MQTELLKAFYGFAESNMQRLGSVEHDASALKERLATIERRVSEVERRLNMPPAA